MIILFLSTKSIFNPLYSSFYYISFEISLFINIFAYYINIMEGMGIAINRIKSILVEKNRTNKWLALTLRKNEASVSRWCTNENQPSLETLYQIAQVLDIDIRLLLNKTK